MPFELIKFREFSINAQLTKESMLNLRPLVEYPTRFKATKLQVVATWKFVEQSLPSDRDDKIVSYFQDVNNGNVWFILSTVFCWKPLGY